MRNLRILLSLMLALSLLLSITPAAAAFTDENEIDYNEAVAVLTDLRVFQSYADGSFMPTQTVTREEIAAIIYRVATGDVNDTQASLHTEGANFRDVNSTSWSAGYIGFCYSNKLLATADSDKFEPSKDATGYEVLSMILRAIGYGQNGEFTGDDWQKNVETLARDLGILKNISSATLLSQPVTRDLAAELVFRTIADVQAVTHLPESGYQDAGSALDKLRLNKKDWNKARAKFALTNIDANPGMVYDNHTSQQTFDDNDILHASFDPADIDSSADVVVLTNYTILQSQNTPIHAADTTIPLELLKVLVDNGQTLIINADGYAIQFPPESLAALYEKLSASGEDLVVQHENQGEHAFLFGTNAGIEVDVSLVIRSQTKPGGDACLADADGNKIPDSVVIASGLGVAAPVQLGAAPTLLTLVGNFEEETPEEEPDSNLIQASVTYLNQISQIGDNALHLTVALGYYADHNEESDEDDGKIIADLEFGDEDIGPITARAVTKVARQLQIDFTAHADSLATGYPATVIPKAAHRQAAKEEYWGEPLAQSILDADLEFPEGGDQYGELIG